MLARAAPYGKALVCRYLRRSARAIHALALANEP